MTRMAIVAGFGESWINLLSIDEIKNVDAAACRGIDGGRESRHCGSSCCGGCRENGRPFRAALPKDINLKKGDIVEVSASTIRAAAAFLLIIGLPLLLSAAGWFAARTVFRGALADKDAIGAVAGLLAGIGIVLAAGQRKADEHLPMVTAVVER